MGMPGFPRIFFLKTAVTNLRKGTGFFLVGVGAQRSAARAIGISQPVYPTKLRIAASQQSIVSARLNLRYEALVSWLNRS